MSAAASPATWAAIAAGAVLGAWARFALGLALNRAGTPMPWGTLAANVVGALAIGETTVEGLLEGEAMGMAVESRSTPEQLGALAVFERRPELSAAWRPFLVTGLLGALTTFSTFSAESLQLIQRGALGHALLHTGAHLLGSLAAAAFGYRLASV